MLGFGGAGGIINMSYQLNETVHNTQWVTGHFHLIFGGAIVIMYFMVAYELWPQLTRSAPLPRGVIRLQLWLWFVGMMVLTLPWHLVGLLGMPRRMAYFDYRHPAIEPQAWTVTMSTIGGLMLVVSALLFVFILARAHRSAAEPRAVHLQRRRASRRRGRRSRSTASRLWVAMMIGADGRELRLPDRAARAPEGDVGAGRADREPLMAERVAMSWRNPWVRGSVGVLVALTVVAMLVGFVWLPSVQADFSAQGLWASICRAAGVPVELGPGGDAARDARARLDRGRPRARDGARRRPRTRSAAAPRWRSTARCATARRA